MAATFTASAQFKAVDKMSRPFKAMSKASRSFANKAEIAFARVQRKVRKLKSAIGGLGLAIGAGLLIGAIGSTTKVFMDFEQANANLASVMGVTVQQNKDLADDAKRLGATTAKTAAEVVGLQEAFARLGFQKSDILNMTEATISGSIAMQGELADTAELVGAMVKSFDNFSSLDTPNIINQMTMATQKSALNFEKLQTGLPIVAGAANAAGVPFTRLLALMGKLSDAGIDTSSSATALRNIFIDSAKKGHSYEQILANIQKNQSKLTAANDEFGKRGAVSAVILAKQMGAVDSLDKALQGAKNTAQEAADKQLATLSGSITILKSAWEGFILSIEDGNGKIGNALKTIIKTATEMLSMASGTEKAKDQLNKAQLKIRLFAERGLIMLKIIKWTIAAFIGFRVVIGIIRAVTAAQAALNFVMSMNPIGLLIIGIAALIALVVVIIKKWEKWGAAVSMVLGPIGLIISLVKSFRNNWELVKASFSSGGILKGLLTIGKVILDAILMPVQQLLELIGKIPGLNIANRGAAKIEGIRENIFAQERALTPKEELSTTRTAQRIETKSTLERISKQSATLNINNNTDNPMSVDAPPGFPVKLSTTN